jgi:PAS domain S-box-containing protein
MVDETAEDLYENAPCGYLSSTLDGRIIRVNATFERWTGFRREDLVGTKRFADLLSVGGRIYHETHYAPLLRMQGAVREIALEIVRADGRRLPVLVNSVLVRDADGAPVGVRTTVLDATERQAYERELLAARDRERAARAWTERLLRLAQRLAAATTPAAVADALLDELTAAFGAPRAGLVVRDADGALRTLGARGDVAGLFTAGEPVVHVPFSAAPGIEGRVSLELPAPRALDEQEQGFLTASAGQAALALERARLHAQTRNVALALQRSLLGELPAPDPRFEVASLYQPAVRHLEVGGDWNDVVALPGGATAFVVGDVVGRGLGAATAMGQLRSAVRALAGAEHSPAAVLARLDTFVEYVDAARYATVAIAVLAPDARRVTLACAGHLPPVLLAPERAPELLTGGRSLPVGLVDRRVPRAETAVELAPGGGLLLYTDGLVERRGESIDTGLARLLAAARDSAAPEALTAALLPPEGSDDDVCVLSVRLRREPAQASSSA